MMNVSGEHRVAAPREQVWQALHNPDTLRVCIPGCEDVHEVEPHVFSGRMMARIGAVSTVFTGRLMISDESSKGWQVAAHAESPSAGWADGTASITLSSVSGGTTVAYRLHVDPGGRLAAVGDRLLRGVAMRMANDFFTRLTEQLMPEPHHGEPQDRSDPAASPPRRKVLPLAPTPEPLATSATPARTNVPTAMPRGQRIIIAVGAAYCAFILLSLGLALASRL